MSYKALKAAVNFGKGKKMKNNELLQQVCDMLNKECTFESWSKWYTVKNGRIHWDNDVCGGFLDETEIFELLGQKPAQDRFAPKKADLKLPRGAFSVRLR